MGRSLSSESAARRAARVGTRLGDVGIEPDGSPAGAEDLSSLGVKELRARAKAAGLPTSGKKDELVARLSAA